MNEIRDFQVTDGHVVAVSEHAIVVDCGDERPALGSLVQVDGQVFRAIAYNGLRQVTAQALGRHTVGVGADVEFGSKQACFPKPSTCLDVAEARWLPEGLSIKPRRASFAELAGQLLPVPVGHVGLDAVAPLVRGGSNLIVHGGTGARELAVATLGGATVSVNAGPATYQLKGDSDHDELMAWRLGMVWASALRDASADVVLVGRLPLRSDAVVNKEAVEARGLTLAEFVDELLDGVFSTQTAKISAVFHLDVPSGHHLHPILETLPLGSFDAVWFIDAHGVPDLTRCFSRAADGQASGEALVTLDRFARLQNQQKLGLANPEDGALDAIRSRASGLLMPLLDGPQSAH